MDCCFRSMTVSTMCQSIQQTPDGKSRVGGKPSTRREERQKGNCGRHGVEPVSLLCDTDAVTQRAQDVTHRCE